MHYGIAIWNFAEPGVSLPALVAWAAEAGFDAASFSSGQFGKVDEGEWRETGACLRERGMIATIHCSFNAPVPEILDTVESLGAVRAVTFDAAMAVLPQGRLYDWDRMGATLCELEQATRGSDIGLGVEDFPLGQCALDFYADAIPAALLDCPRYGMLIDLGHLHLRRTKEPYFQRLTPEEYIAAIPLPILEAHVHDNTGDADSHGHIGFGDAPFDAMASGLRAAGFDGVSTIEIAPSFHGSTPEQSRPHAIESLAQWRRLMAG